MLKVLSAAALAAVMSVGAASAATLSGLFTVDIVNATNMNFAQSTASPSAFDTAWTNAASSSKGTITYDGALDFSTTNPNDSTTIAQWLGTGGGLVSGLVSSLGDLTLSHPDINSGTAQTTFFRFTLAALGASDFSILHDDGISVLDDGTVIGSSANPTVAITTDVNGFNGGQFGLIYVATNGNPSKLTVDASPVPLPATGLLLLGGLGGIAALKRRKKAA